MHKKPKNNFSNRTSAPKTDNNKIWLYGKHAVIAALKSNKRKFYRLLVTKNNLELIQDLLPKELTPELITGFELSEIMGNDAIHQGIALYASILPVLNLDYLNRLKNADKAVILILDQITDPHNLGAIIRTAVAFNADAVITTIHHSASETSTVAKAAVGGIEDVNLIPVTNLVNCINHLKDLGFWVLGLDGEAKDIINSSSLTPKTAFILGSEDKGLRRLTKENCDNLIKININSTMESLNVSNAAAIALYEYSKI